MRKTILVTGATDGIGLETVGMLVSMGHNVLLHGRNQSKVEKVEKELSGKTAGGQVESYIADLTNLSDVEDLADAVAEKHEKLDVLINNAGVFVTPNPINKDGLDVRYVVNTIAPYLLTQKLIPMMNSTGRVINLASAAQASVDVKALGGSHSPISDGAAYAQSKLALLMWSRHMAHTIGDTGPAIVSVNPRSFLGSKMVQEAYGTAGSDLRIGGEILCRAALSEEFATASGKYFDNDIGNFSSPHPDALDEMQCQEITRVINRVIDNTTKQQM